jgi:hypothetical protein
MLCGRKQILEIAFKLLYISAMDDDPDDFDDDEWQKFVMEIVDSTLRRCEQHPVSLESLRQIRGLAEYAAESRRRTLAAIKARKQFDKHKPDWAPQLPLRKDECEALQRNPDNRIKLVGYYGLSQRGVYWSFPRHPSFVKYARSLLAHPNVPKYLLGDANLLAEFPPKPLPGLDEHLCWLPGLASHSLQLRFSIVR